MLCSTCLVSCFVVCDTAPVFVLCWLLVCAWACASGCGCACGWVHLLSKDVCKRFCKHIEGFGGRRTSHPLLLLLLLLLLLERLGHPRQKLFLHKLYKSNVSKTFFNLYFVKTNE